MELGEIRYGDRFWDQFDIGYMLMLAVQHFVAIVLSLAIGYFLFRIGEDDVSIDNPCDCAQYIILVNEFGCIYED